MMTMNWSYNVVVGGIYKHYESGELVKVLCISYDAGPFGKTAYQSLLEKMQHTNVIYKFLSTGEVFNMNHDQFVGMVWKVKPNQELVNDHFVKADDVEDMRYIFEYTGTKETPKCKCDLMEMEMANT